MKVSCTYINAERIVCTAKRQEVMRKMDRLPTGKKQWMSEEMNGVHIYIMAELE